MRPLAVTAALLCSCAVSADLRLAQSPAAEAAAISVIEDTYRVAGLTIDVAQLEVSWWSGSCLPAAQFNADTFQVEEVCAQGLAITCIIEVIKKDSIGESSLAHEMMHCALYQAGRLDWFRHTAIEWQYVHAANARLKNMGL